jgi:hypothetical protein
LYYLVVDQNFCITMRSKHDVRPIFNFVKSFDEESSFLTAVLGLGFGIVDADIPDVTGACIVGAVKEDVKLGAVLVRGAGDTARPKRIPTDPGKDEVPGFKFFLIFIHFAKNF